MATTTKPAASANTPVKKAPVKKAPVRKPTARKPAVRKATPKATPKATAKPAAPKPVAAPKLPVKKTKKAGKEKIIRDSFALLESEYRKIAEIKDACLKAGLKVKKSEVLRAGLKVLGSQSVAQWKQSLGGLMKIKTGRQKKR